MSTSSFFMGVRDASATMLRGYEGDRVPSPGDRCVTVRNKAPQAVQIDTVDIPDPVTASDIYSITINTTTASYTAAASGETQDNVGAQLVAAIQGAPAIAGLVTASYAGGTVTITGNFEGIAHTVAITGTGATTANTQPAADADAVGFGRVLITDGTFTNGVRNVGLPLSGSDLSAAFAGISVRGPTENATETGDDPAFKADAGFEMLQNGAVLLYTDLSVGDSLYVETSNTNLDRGRIYRTNSGTRIALPASLVRVERPTSDMGDNLARVRILATAL